MEMVGGGDARAQDSKVKHLGKEVARLDKR